MHLQQLTILRIVGDGRGLGKGGVGDWRLFEGCGHFWRVVGFLEGWWRIASGQGGLLKVLDGSAVWCRCERGAEGWCAGSLRGILLRVVEVAWRVEVSSRALWRVAKVLLGSGGLLRRRLQINMAGCGELWAPLTAMTKDHQQSAGRCTSSL